MSERRYSVRNPDGGELGPASEEEVCVLIAQGSIHLDATACETTAGEFQPITQFRRFRRAFEARFGINSRLQGSESTPRSPELTPSVPNTPPSDPSGTIPVPPRPSKPALRRVRSDDDPSTPITLSSPRTEDLEVHTPVTHGALASLDDLPPPMFTPTTGSAMRGLAAARDLELPPLPGDRAITADAEPATSSQSQAPIFGELLDAGDSEPVTAASAPPVFGELLAAAVSDPESASGSDTLSEAPSVSELESEPELIRTAQSEPLAAPPPPSAAAPSPIPIVVGEPLVSTIEFPPRAALAPSLHLIPWTVGAFGFLFLLFYGAGIGLNLGNEEAAWTPSTYYWARILLLVSGGIGLSTILLRDVPLTAEVFQISGRWLGAAIAAGGIIGAAGPPQRLGSGLAIALAMAVLRVVGEEVFFRGFIDRALFRAVPRPAMAIAISALMYGCFQLSYGTLWLDRSIGAAILYALGSIFVLGVPLSTLHHRSQGFIAPFTCHLLAMIVMLALS